MTTVQITPSTVVAHPAFEGSNIRTWVGFKHFMYLAEQAVLQWFRDRDLGPQRLFHDEGLRLEVVDSSVQLPAVLQVDDQVEVQASQRRDGRFAVRMTLVDDPSRALLRGTIAVALVRVRDHDSSSGSRSPALAPIVDSTREVQGAVEAQFIDGVDDPLRRVEESLPGAFVWSWKCRYFHCHYSASAQHSAYVRALEEVVDRFLEDRGLGIPALLDERGWIPVVSRARVQLAPTWAEMGDVVYTAFVLDELVKDLAWGGKMTCFVRRGDRLEPTAVARILHGYAIGRGPDVGTLARLDPTTVSALRGGVQL